MESVLSHTGQQHSAEIANNNTARAYYDCRWETYKLMLYQSFSS
jgi:hypothetical protein